MRLHIHRYRVVTDDQWNWGGIIAHRVVSRCRCGVAKVRVRGTR